MHFLSKPKQPNEFIFLLCTLFSVNECGICISYYYVHNYYFHVSRSLTTILNSENEETLQELAGTFTTLHSHFDALHIVELEEGGGDKRVTMANKKEFVDKLCNWHLQSEFKLLLFF